ncbi:hypothetical protein HOY80DRAFT_1047367 [Tuber brumale]|nr:hypothetical protein HOY80DRAFT_1047367 [Tuber brumale]
MEFLRCPLDAAFNTLAPKLTQCQLSNGVRNVYSMPISMKFLQRPLDAVFSTLAPRPTRRQLSSSARNVYSTPISMEVQAVIEVVFPSEVLTKY